MNGVAAFADRLDAAGGDIRDLAGVRIAAIGPETARAVRALHLHVDVMPEEFRAEGVIEALGEVKGKRVLLPRAAGAREILPRELEKRGASVDEVIAYRSVLPQRDTGEMRRALESGEIDMLTFTSSSTVRHFVEIFPRTRRRGSRRRRRWPASDRSPPPPRPSSASPSRCNRSSTPSPPWPRRSATTSRERATLDSRLSTLDFFLRGRTSA